MPADSTADSPQHAEPMLRLRGLRVGNLQGVNLDLPTHRVICLAGVAGSGKSSLAFRTIYAEGQRRFLETLSPGVRQFLEQYDHPEADEIGALPPTIAVQRPWPGRSTHPMTVARYSQVWDALSAFFCQAGTIVCPTCGCEVKRQSPTDAQRQIGELSPGTRLLVGFRLQRALTSGQEPIGFWLRQSGFRRLLVGETFVDIESTTTPAVLHLLTSRPAEWDTIAATSDGSPAAAILVIVDRLVAGRGEPDRFLDSLETGYRLAMQEVVLLVETEDHAPREVTRTIDGRVFAQQVFSDETRCLRCGVEFPRPEPSLLQVESPDDKTALSHVLRIDGRSMVDVVSGSAEEVLAWLNGLTSHSRASGPRLTAARELLLALCETGLAKLPLDAELEALSVGELGLLMLAAAQTTGVVNSLFVVDAPAAGLTADGIRLAAKAVRNLQRGGNTVIAVESTPDFLDSADWIVELGPGSGSSGGQVVDQGTPADICPRMQQRWAEELQKAARPGRRVADGQAEVVLPPDKRVDAGRGTWKLPLQCLTVLTAANLQGAEEWFRGTFFERLAAAVTAPDGNRPGEATLPCEAALLLDSGPVSGSRRSTVATYLKLMGEIRKVFAETRDARARNLDAAAFSFNARAGQCPVCRGLGQVRIDMQFLPDVSMTCPECHGNRYRPEILDVRYRGLSIADILQLTADEAFPLFRGARSLQKKIGMLRELGLGTLPIGQATNELTTCDSQRLRLATVVGGVAKQRTVFLLVDPSAGLHPLDIHRQLIAFDRVLERGHSLVVLDRSPQLIAAADHLISLQ